MNRPRRISAAPTMASGFTFAPVNGSCAVRAAAAAPLDEAATAAALLGVVEDEVDAAPLKGSCEVPIGAVVEVVEVEVLVDVVVDGSVVVEVLVDVVVDGSVVDVEVDVVVVVVQVLTVAL